MMAPAPRPAPVGSTEEPFALGIDALLDLHPDWLAGRRVGLVSHNAAVDSAGQTTAERLHAAPGVRLVALFGPEHGFRGRAGAGETTGDERHPEWDIPIYSLYGPTRRPTPAMLAPLDTLVVDFQDLGARPYTYVSTLRLVLEAAAEAGKRVIVADRPVPLAGGCDGPVLEPAQESFVGLVGTSLQYGMTPGEAATWIARWLRLSLDLRVAGLRGYHRDPLPGAGWPAWVPPSPRIRSWECGLLFTCTVAGEALPAVDYGSGTPQSFQLIAAPALSPEALAERLRAAALPGVEPLPVAYVARAGLYAGQRLQGLRLTVTDAAHFKPVTTCVHWLAAVRDLLGTDRLWGAPGTRPDFFDKLFGTSSVREALQAGMDGAAIAALWRDATAAFSTTRAAALLYPDETT